MSPQRFKVIPDDLIIIIVDVVSVVFFSGTRGHKHNSAQPYCHVPACRETRTGSPSGADWNSRNRNCMASLQFGYNMYRASEAGPRAGREGWYITTTMSGMFIDKLKGDRKSVTKRGQSIYIYIYSLSKTQGLSTIERGHCHADGVTVTWWTLRPSRAFSVRGQIQSVQTLLNTILQFQTWL